MLMKQSSKPQMTRRYRYWPCQTQKGWIMHYNDQTLIL